MRDILRSLLDRCDELRTTLRASTCPKQEIVRQAHDIGAIGGMLGFAELGAACTDLQRRADEDAHRRGRASIAGALDRAIDALRRDLGDD